MLVKIFIPLLFSMSVQSQPSDKIFKEGIKETELNISLSVFPNPTANNLTLQISDYNNQKLSYQLIDMQGKLLSNGQVTAQQTQNQQKVVQNGKDGHIYQIKTLSEN